jgi:hypothetical protein
MKLSRTLLTIALAALVFPALPACAQLGIYGGFTAGQLSLPTGIGNENASEWTYGGDVGAYLAHGHFLFFSAGVDARADILKGSSAVTTGNASYNIDSGYIGPRVGFKPHVLPIQPYVEGLVGAAHIADTIKPFPFVPVGSSGSTAAIEDSETKFSYQIVGGLDYTIFPRIDWRVAEISYGTLKAFGSNVNPTTVSTGIVIRLPGVF